MRRFNFSRTALVSVAFAAVAGAALAQTAGMAPPAATTALIPSNVMAGTAAPVVVAQAAPATTTAAQAAAAAASAAKRVEKPKASVAPVLCDLCGKVEDLRQETRKGKGGAMGIVGGALAGGVLGNQVGGGDGKKIATVGGAVAGAVAGNEVQKRLGKRKVWVSSVRMKDGSVKLHEQEAVPVWKLGDTVRAEGTEFVKL